VSSRHYIQRTLSRRVLLRGAGVALTLPWLESLAPRVAGAQAAGTILRYIPIFLPNGASENWKPSGQGQGAAWQLSGVLSPLQALKAKVQILTNMENGSAFNADGSASVEPSHGRQPGAWLTSVNFEDVIKATGAKEANGVSVDQVLADTPLFKDKTSIPSLQVGLSTVYASCDGKQCSNSRSVSWHTQTQPMYKKVDPLDVFNTLTGGGGGPGPVGNPDDPAVKQRLALKKSVLDAVLENANNTNALLSSADKMRMEEFLQSVRDVEKQAIGVSAGMGGTAMPGGTPGMGTMGCAAAPKPTMATVTPDGITGTTATYNKGTHADVMNGLIVMALQCDLTRIVSYMLEDERSEFTYDHVVKRTFPSATSVAMGTGNCGNYHGSQHGSQDEFASISWWNVSKVAELATKLDAIKDPDGKTMLDNSVIFLGGCMHGANHSCNELPTALIGGGGGKLKGDQHVVYAGSKPLRHLHFTLLNDVFQAGVADFGKDAGGKPVGKLPEIIA
jgi:hypothetical protein